MELNNDSLEVLLLIGRNGPISRTRIASILSLTPSRMSRLADRLLRSGLIHECGQEKSRGGRRSVLLDLREENFLLCGILLSHLSFVQVVLLDLGANIVGRRELDVPIAAGPDDVADLIAGAVQECRREQANGDQRILGAGIGVAGTVDPRAGVIHNSPGFPGCREAKLGEMVSERLDIPTFLDNEVALWTLGEMWFGKGRRCSDFLFLNLGPGVRMGIVINGSLYRGATGNAGEVGHITSDPDGPFCHCGNAGCLEQFVSSEALRTAAQSALTPRSASLLAELCGRDPAQLEIDMIFDAAEKGDRLARSLVNRFAEPLGRTVAGLVNIFDTEKIIVSGSLIRKCDIMIRNMKECIDRHALPVLGRQVILEKSEFDRTGTTLGGGALVLQKICDKEIVL